MATVRLSMSLRDRIKTKALAGFSAAHPEPKLSAEHQEFLVEAIRRSDDYQKVHGFAEFVDTLRNSPPNSHKNSFAGADRVQTGFLAVETVSVVYNRRREDGTDVRKKTHVKLDNKVNLASISGWPHHGYDVPISSLNPSDSLVVTQFVSELDERVDENRNKFFEYKKQIEHLLSSCNTLKQVLKVWPQAEVFIPSDVMDMHREKAKPKAPKSVDNPLDSIEFDTATANAVAVRARMLGSV